MRDFTINLLPEGFKEPPVYFHTASSCFPQNTMKYPEGAQSFYQILLVLDGTGILHCSGSTYPLKRGCAFFTAQGHPSEYVNTGNLTTAFLTVRGSALPALLLHYKCGPFLFAEHVNLEKYLSDMNFNIAFDAEMPDPFGKCVLFGDRIFYVVQIKKRSDVSDRVLRGNDLILLTRHREKHRKKEQERKCSAHSLL